MLMQLLTHAPEQAGQGDKPQQQQQDAKQPNGKSNIRVVALVVVKSWVVN